MEFRFGPAPGEPEQFQSVIAPSKTTEGISRRFGSWDMVMETPECIFADLERHAGEKHDGAAKKGNPKGSRRKSVSVGSGRRAGYGARALADECEAVRSAPVGDRNKQLNKSAFKLGGLVAEGLLTADEVRAALAEAAREAGLDDDEIAATIESGLAAGIAEPRDTSHVGAGRNGHAPASPPSGGGGGGDPSDDGGDDEDWEPTADDARQAAQARAAKMPELCNFRIEREEVEDENGKKQIKESKVPMTLPEIFVEYVAIWDDLPISVRGELFGKSLDYEAIALENHQLLFAYSAQKLKWEWKSGDAYPTKDEFFRYNQIHRRSYDSIESLPHEPGMENAYYLHPPLPKPEGKLDEFVKRFSPHTDEDRELLKLLVITCVWGGPPGRRPAFLITGPEGDAEQGRGLGKTTFPQVVAEELLTGYIDISTKDDMATIKSRLLSRLARQIRMALLDNIKSLHFSWADLESLITASEISGKTLYKGEGRRPNTLVYVLTLNGASLSKDMSPRVAVIRIDRPTYSATWEEDTRAFAREHRWSILADCAAFLRQPPGPLVARTRWASWEHQVLSKIGDRAAACQQVIIDRQGQVDDDGEEQALVAELFAVELARCWHTTNKAYVDPAKDCVFIPSANAADWLARATRKAQPTNQATSHLDGLGIPQLRRSKKTGARGFIWTGRDAKPGSTAQPIVPPRPPLASAPERGGTGAEEIECPSRPAPQ